MTRVMLDTLDPDRIPLPQPPRVLIGAYVGHSDNPDSYTQALARFPDHQVVSIAARTHHDAQILDIEHGAVEPNDTATINDWCRRQRARGVTPTLYVNEATWPTVAGRVVGSRNWWAANWSKGPVIPPGAVGVQYGGVPGAFDTSILLDYIPGIDAVPLPPIEDDMAYLTPYIAGLINAPIGGSVGDGYYLVNDNQLTALHLSGPQFSYHQATGDVTIRNGVDAAVLAGYTIIN